MSATLASLVASEAGRQLGVVLHGDGEVLVNDIRHDSRQVQAGDLFVAISGARADGAAFVEQAIRQGAVAVLAEQPLAVEVPQLRVPSARRALGPLAHWLHGDPTRAMSVVGLTGTNGKTSVCYLLEAALGHLGREPAAMGTVAMRAPGQVEQAAAHTTPEGDAIARFARAAVDGGASHLLMEVSSHALQLHRADGVHFAVAAFTNLSRDHLDFHGDMASYGEAKARLFTELPVAQAVINVADPFGAELARRFTGDLLRCSAEPDADAEVRVLRWESQPGGLVARVATPGGEVELRSGLIGKPNLENLLVAFGCGYALGEDAAKLADALSQAEAPPGRFERVRHPGGVLVVVDYAHTPDALERALRTLRPLTTGRLLVVFGCGGDRDVGKRGPMGQAAARCADLAVLTSDNPRTEDPLAILAAIEAGVQAEGWQAVDGEAFGSAEGGAYTLVEDRRAAMELALATVRPGDTLLIAGKGHEAHVVHAGESRPFDDREVAAQLIAAQGRGRE